MVLNKIGDAYMIDQNKRDLVKQALEIGGLTVALQSETGIIIMEEIEENKEIDEEG